MKIYDLIDRGKYIDVYRTGIIDRISRLSMTESETIQNVLVVGKNGNIVLRYAWNPETEHINHTAERFENWIDEHYTRI